MRLGSSRRVMCAAGMAAVWLLGVAVRGQAQEQTQLMSEQVFTNVKVLKGLSVNEFLMTMGVFSASLGWSCQNCHSGDDRNWAAFAKESTGIRTTRRMITMMAEINKTQFGGRQAVTCFTCHRGSEQPRTAADLDLLYGPPPDIPSHLVEQAPTAPSADQVLDKYIQALGGAQRLAALTSFTARGTAVGYGPESLDIRPTEIYARAPNQLTTIIHTESGDITTANDGRVAWLASTFRPIPVVSLSGQDLEAARMDAIVAFPGQIKQALRNVRVGFPAAIDGREVHVVQGTTAAGALVTLSFDAETGLLVRQMRYVASPVGPLATRVDYADYREVAGVKVPYRLTQTRLNGREKIELTEVRPNVPIDAARFAKPAAPPPR